MAKPRTFAFHLHTHTALILIAVKEQSVEAQIQIHAVIPMFLQNKPLLNQRHGALISCLFIRLFDVENDFNYIFAYPLAITISVSFSHQCYNLFALSHRFADTFC